VEQVEEIKSELSKRRTFAIISHPDAGKTTLTEKLLLYAGMLRTAGMVQGRKNRKGASSDWMQMEQERGISITASAMQFAYKDVIINVLDTPGHQDFSEDTYRTLTAADSAVMVIDSAKGVEPQTRKLFAVCKMRGIPILTFINKMDLAGREPLDLIAEVEEVLQINASPINWPVGQGKNFKGVYDRFTKKVLLFEKASTGGAKKAVLHEHSIAELADSNILDQNEIKELNDSISLLDEAGNPYDLEKFLAGQLTPVFFGSALTNFGIEPFFDHFAKIAPCPRARPAKNAKGEVEYVDPAKEEFAGYVFKIQANMDLRHRDSMAFIRVCAGKFERDLVIKHTRLNKEIRLSRSHSMFGGERTTVDAAYPGDIVGVVNPGSFAIGDSISVRGDLTFSAMPKFPPEVVAEIRPKDALKRKAFENGMTQFRNEGAVLILEGLTAHRQNPLVAAVGPLQFEVIQHRLTTEYKVETVLDQLPYRFGAWLVGNHETFSISSGSMLARDALNNIIFLYSQDWQKGYALEKNPDHKLVDFLHE
jgi:peptide chain release factor 3